MRSAAIYFLSSDSNARARSSLPQLAGGFSAGGHERGRPQSCLLLQDLRAAMAPRCVTVSVATAMRPRACSLAHASMPHAARRALAMCDPHVCAWRVQEQNSLINDELRLLHAAGLHPQRLRRAGGSGGGLIDVDVVASRPQRALRPCRQRCGRAGL